MRIVEKDGVVRIAVRAKPKARVSAVVGVREDCYEVALAAPPVDGAANDELVRLFSEVLRLPKRHISLARGASSRAKIVAVTSLATADILLRLEAAIAT